MTDTPLTPLAAAPETTLVTLELPRTRSRARFVVAFLVGLLAALGLGASALYAFDREYTGKVLPGVSVGGIDLSGLTPEQATARLKDAYGSFADGRAIITSGSLEMTIDYADVQRRADIEGMVAEAMAVGRSESAVERIILDVRTAIRGVDIEPRVLFNEARLARYIRMSAARVDIDPQDASVAPTEDGFAVVEGVSGRTADRLAPTAALTAALARADAPSEIRIELELSPVTPDVTTEDAAAAQVAAGRMARDIAILEGKETWTIPAATVRSWLAFKTDEEGLYGPVIQPALVDATLAEVAKEIAQAPVNASFTVSGSKVTGVSPAKVGRALDIAPTAKRINEILAGRAATGGNAPVVPSLVVTEPSLTTAEAEAAAPKMTKISSWTTYFPISDRNHFGANIWIPALDIDGYVVGPGETFDFWNAVGPVTRARGYGDGGAIINGKTEPQGALAGGICSCSTTLFNAALRAGFDMGSRRNHYYYIDRYPIGLDATVFKSGSGSVQTMSWTNDTDYPVLIRGYKIKDGSKGYVRFDLYSVPTGRRVVISDPTIKNIRRATDTTQVTSTLAPGVRKRIEYPVDGKDVWRTVTVYQGKTILHQTTYYSHYARITGITLVGKAD